MEDKPLKSLECQVKSLHFFKENFPSDPLVRTPRSHCWEPRFRPWLENWDPRNCTWPKNKKEKFHLSSAALEKLWCCRIHTQGSVSRTLSWLVSGCSTNLKWGKWIWKNYGSKIIYDLALNWVYWRVVEDSQGFMAQWQMDIFKMWNFGKENSFGPVAV